MLFFETESGKEVFEIFGIELCLSLFINHSQKTSDFLSGYFSSAVFDKSLNILSSDVCSIAAEHWKYVIGIEVERAEKGLMEFCQSILKVFYWLYWVTISEKSLEVIHYTFWSNG